MKLLQAIKNFFAPQPKEPIVFVTPEPAVVTQDIAPVVPEPVVAEPASTITVLATGTGPEVQIIPEPVVVTSVEEVKVSPAKDWPTVTTVPDLAWPFPATRPVEEKKKQPTKKKQKATEAATKPARIKAAPKTKSKTTTKGSKK